MSLLLQKKGLRAKVRAKARTSALVARTLENNTDWTTWSPDDLTYIASNNSSTLDTDKLNMSSVSLTAEDDYDNQFAIRNAVTGFLSGIANAVVGVVNAVTPDSDPSEIPGGEEEMRAEGELFRNAVALGVESEYNEVQGGTETVLSDRDFSPITQVAKLVTGAVSALADPFVAPAPEGAPNFYADAAGLVTRPIFAAADALDNALPDGYLGGPGPATRAQMAVPQADDDGEIDGAAAEPTEAEKNAKLAARVARTAQKAEAARQESDAAQKAVDVEMGLLKDAVTKRVRFVPQRPIGTDEQIRESAKTASTFGLTSRARGSWPDYVEELIAKKNAGTLSPGQRILLEDLERHRINKAIDKLRREDEARVTAAPSNPLKALADTVIGVADSIASTVAPKKWYEGYEPAATQTAVSSATTPTSQTKWYQGYNAADYQPGPSGKWSSAPRTSARIAQAKAMQDAHYAGKPEARAKDAGRKAKQTQSLARYKGNVAKLDFRGTGNNL